MFWGLFESVLARRGKDNVLHINCFGVPKKLLLASYFPIEKQNILKG